MPAFSSRSLRRLHTCEPEIIKVFESVIEDVDCTILEGHRDAERQNWLYETGKSQLLYPDSLHNSRPSRAIDVAPYPIDWHDRERLTFFAGFVLGRARGLGVALRWGGDWDGDWLVRDNSFDDLVHFELAR